MAPKLYGMWLSGATMKAHLTLLELGLEYEFEVVNLRTGEQRQPEFLAKNPFGTVPVLEDGDVTLFESSAIMRYLADKYPGNGPALYGATLAERASVEQWLEAAGQNFTEPARELVMQTAFSALKPKNEELFEQSLKLLERVLDIYDERLQCSRYLAGDFISLADLVHIPHTFHLVCHCPPAKELVHGRKHVKAWWEDITARPTWQRVAQACTADMAKVVS